ncbi:MAG: invasion associated locus B family protein [Paracoccaceae bacterium]
MTKILKITMAIALVLTLPIVAYAQDTTTTETPEPTPADAEAPSSDSSLSLGQELVDGEIVGTTYVRETYGDWALRCIRTADGKDPCQLYQLMKDGNGNSVAEISLFELPAGQQAVAGATIAAPLETLLTEQLTLQVDGGGSKRYPFSYCASQACYVRIGLTAQDLDGFQRGASATVIIVPVAAPDTHLGLNLSLSGFTNGYKEMQASNLAIKAE